MTQGYPALLRVLGMIDGFVLVPVELAGLAGALRLHRWLRRHGHDLDFERLDGDSVGRLIARTRGVIAVGSSDTPDADVALLRRVNQARDAVARPPFPILWCGSTDWLALTWQHAPDFWSVRAQTRSLRPDPAGPAQSGPEWAGEAGFEDAARLRQLRDLAREQADRLNAARLGYALAAALAAGGDVAAASAAIGEAVADLARGAPEPDLAFDLHLLGARLALAAGEGGVARRWLATARSLAAGSVGKEAQIGLIAAESALRSGRKADAVQRYARLLPGLADRPLLAARARVGLGRSLVRAGAYKAGEDMLRDAVALFQSQGEALGEATALVELGDLCRRTGRLAQARDLLLGALESFVEGGLTAAAERTHELLALVELADGRPGEARVALIAAGADRPDAGARKQRLYARTRPM